MNPPAFWRHDGLTARALTPVSRLVAAVTARRIARPGTRVGVPVCCVGNVSVGGSGKTPLVLDLAARLIAAGARPHILVRGYGGTLRGPHRVTAADTAARAGDEALLLARAAPTWVGADRVASACRAIAAGADILLMDDGMQNPGLRKTTVILAVDPAGLGNGRVLPAGPLREPLAAGFSRAEWVVRFGDVLSLAMPPSASLEAAWPTAPSLTTLSAHLAPGPTTRALAGQTVFAFAGIGRPEKFFGSLRDAGAVLAGTRAFPDHHTYSATDVARLRRAAGGATPVTTAKDAVRLPPWPGLAIADVTVVWNTPPDGLVAHLLQTRRTASTPAATSNSG